MTALDKEELATLRSIRAFVQKKDRPPLASEIGAAASRKWPPNRERAAALAKLVGKGLVKRSESDRCWLTKEGREAIG